MGWQNRVEFSDLVGKTLAAADVSDYRDLITFRTTEGEVYEMFHDQDCCENVTIEDICGDLQALVGDGAILSAEEVTNVDEPPIGDYVESYTWTFYHIRTMHNTVTIRWYGESNGYYSESVSIEKYAKGER